MAGQNNEDPDPEDRTPKRIALPLRMRLVVAIILAATMMTIAPRSATAHTSRIRVLSCNRQALQARIDLIQCAQESIDITYYSVNTDEVPIAIIELLRQAACRGVKVRLLLDGFKSRLPRSFKCYLQQCGIDIRVYHPTNSSTPHWLNRRLHCKLLVTDSVHAITGSRNLENSHFAVDDSHNFCDCDLYVGGKVAENCRSYFDWLWNSKDVAEVRQPRFSFIEPIRIFPLGDSHWRCAWRKAKNPSDYQRLLSRALSHVTCRCYVQIQPDCCWMNDLIDDVDLQLLHDCRLDKSANQLQRNVVEMMDNARSSVMIVSPYPAFDAPIREAISRTRRRGVRVTILTNSLHSTDRTLVYAAYQNQKRSLLREGVRLREYCGDETLHAKLMIVDDHTWMLGSYNFDARSDGFNLEFCVASDDDAGAEWLLPFVQSQLSKSIAINSAPILSVGGKASIWKQVGMTSERAFVELIRRLL